ncbi:MAG TPA: winged helix DNA-binding domain-containing protein [Phytomonospora sp.]
MIADRALNRTRLARALLLERHRLALPDALERLAGLPAATPHELHLGLWSRLSAYRPAETSRLTADGAVVRIALSDGHEHLVSAADCAWLRPTVARGLERRMRSTAARDIAGIDPRELTATARALLDRDGPLTSAALGKALAAHGVDVGWGERSPEALSFAAASLTGLVAVPPRGPWDVVADPVFMTMETWLGRRAEAADPERLVRRRLAAAGPSTVGELQAWSGLTRLAEVVDRMGLTVYTDVAGETLVDLPGAEIVDPETPAPVRFLPGTVLVDGFPTATWSFTVSPAGARLEVQANRTLTGEESRAVAAEAAGVLTLFAPGRPHEVAGP